MTSSYTNDNLTYTGSLIGPVNTKGTVLANNGVRNFEESSPISDGQLLISDTSTSNGIAWGASLQGLSAGFGIPNGITPNTGGTSYFLIGTATNYVPSMPTSSGRIIFFSVRPDNGNSSASGWSNNPTTITGGSLDYTLGYIAATSRNLTGQFVPYPGAIPHFSIMGNQINDAVKDYNTFTFDLDVPIVEGNQLSIRLQNNLTVTVEPTVWTEQNAFIVIRF